MTSVGKILAFFNLIFSVGTCALIAIVFSTRSNWKAEYEKMKNTALVLEAAFKESDFRHKSELRSKDEEIDARKSNEGNLQNQVTLARTSEGTAKNDLTKAQNTVSLSKENLDAAEKEVKRLQQERDVLAKEKVEREKMIVDMQKDVNSQRQNAVQSENNRKTAEYRSQQLQERLVDVTREREALRAQTASGGSTSVTRPLVPPPPKDVRGSILEVSANGLAAISIGTNQGLSVGNNLEVYRIDPTNPKDSQYLGQLQITSVRPTTAVGQFIPATPRVKIPKIGDEVAATLTGK